MLDFISHVNLIRYLIVWRVNSTLAQLPRYLPTELSHALGTLIASRLPTQPAAEWRKALEGTGEWPLEAVLFAYPGKRTLGRGEIVLWEIKLLGESADHALFLELVLPAMEAAASSAASAFQAGRPHSLWGRFDIQAVYAARGSRWEPVVSEGRLNVDYRASPSQWAEDLTFGAHSKRPFRCLTWITPFDLDAVTDDASGSSGTSRSISETAPSGAPTLHNILDALMSRMTLFLPGKRHARRVQDAWALLSPDEQTAIWLTLQQAESCAKRHTLKPAPRDWPGHWIGAQTFEAIPERLLPYLELASILHIGKQTHLGCGTFMLT